MRKFIPSLGTVALLFVAGPALAQEMFPGQSITVDSNAIGNRPLLYPGGEYMRMERPLLQPFQRPAAPIQLRPPGSRPAPRPAAPRPAEIEEAPEPVAAAPAPKPAPVAAARPAPPPPAPKPAPAPAKQVAATQSAPARTTPAPQAASTNEMAGWTKGGLIEFTPGQGDITGNQLDTVRFLAGSLSNTMSSSANARIQILAYGGARGDKGSDARRLSLRRALAVRQILIDSGVSTNQIDVRAMGGVDDGGPADRVDVYTRS